MKRRYHSNNERLYKELRKKYYELLHRFENDFKTKISLIEIDMVFDKLMEFFTTKKTLENVDNLIQGATFLLAQIKEYVINRSEC